VWNAGTVFVGRWSAQTHGHTSANHTLPTGGTARVAAACSVNELRQLITSAAVLRSKPACSRPHALLAEAEALLPRRIYSHALNKKGDPVNKESEQRNVRRRLQRVPQVRQMKWNFSS